MDLSQKSIEVLNADLLLLQHKKDDLIAQGKEDNPLMAELETMMNAYSAELFARDPSTPLTLQNSLSNSDSGRDGNELHGTGSFINAVTGEKVRAYAPHERIADKSYVPGSIGAIAAGMALNNYDNLTPDIRNAVTSGSGGGSYLLEKSMGQGLIDLSRANSIAVKYGAKTVQISGETHLLKLNTDPTISWRQETATTPGTKPVFGRYTLREKMAACIVPVSIEELEDAANAAQQIETAISGAMGAAIDAGILSGSGASGEMLGLTNNNDVNIQLAVGLPADYSDVSLAVQEILTANYKGELSGLAWVAHPENFATYNAMATGITSDLTPLTAPDWVRPLQRATTTSLSGEMIVGDFSEILIGMRYSGAIIEVLDAGSVIDDDSKTINAVSQFMRFIRARIRMDCVCLRPGYFSVLKGVTTS